jgi:hypothetical protein
MIRLTFLLRRNSELSTEEFQAYWREIHGPRVARHASTLRLLRYVQAYTLTDESRNLPGLRGTMEAPYDGAEEFWWSRREDLVSALETPEGEAAIHDVREDESSFIDLRNSPLWFAHEYPQINPAPEILLASPMGSLVKFYYPIRRLPALSEDEAQLYWATHHGPVIRRTAAAGHVKRYIQVHRYDEEMETRFRDARGTEVEPYMGHAELWFDRAGRVAGADTPERIRAREIAFEDESRFIDFRRSSMWLAKERVFVDRRQWLSPG